MCLERFIVCPLPDPKHRDVAGLSVDRKKRVERNLILCLNIFLPMPLKACDNIFIQSAMRIKRENSSCTHTRHHHYRHRFHVSGEVLCLPRDIRKILLLNFFFALQKHQMRCNVGEYMKKV